MRTHRKVSVGSRPGTVASRPLVGQLGGCGHGYCDTTGPRNVRGCSWFPALRIWRDDRDAALRELDAIAAAGWHFIRIFLAVGGWEGYWGGREVVPVTFTNDRGTRIDAWPDYEEQARTFMLAARERGLKLYTTNGDLQWIFPRFEDRLRHAERTAHLFNDVGPDVCAFMEVCNEWQGNGGEPVEDLRACATRFHALCPFALYTIGAGNGGMEQPEGPGGLYECAVGMPVVTVHGMRSPEAGIRTFGVVYWSGDPWHLDRLILQGEPTGPDTAKQLAQGDGVSVYEEQDPGRLMANMCAGLMSGQAWTYFNGPAVRYHEYGEYQLGSTWGFTELPALFDEALPQDIAQWPYLSHGNKRDTPIGAKSFTDPSETGPARVDQVWNDREVRAIVYGGKGAWELETRRSMHWRVFDAFGGIWEGSGALPPMDAGMTARIIAGVFV